MNQYDVIVVGAGNGGLVAAALTAKAGYRTLLLEKHNIPGGCATSFVRGRFEFEPSLHELCSEATRDDQSSVTSIFRDLGVDVPLLYEDTLLRVIEQTRSLAGEDGAARVHGGGFAGTAQAIVPMGRLETFVAAIERALRPGCCYVVHLRDIGGVRLI